MSDMDNPFAQHDSPFAAEPIYQAEFVDPPRKSQLPLLLTIVGVGMLLVVVAISFYVVGLSMASGGGIAGRLSGTWVHVKGPPSPAAKALMSVGREVVSDTVYKFSAFGSVSEVRYGNFGSETRGAWRLAPQQDGAEDEKTILIEFPDREPIRMHIRFLDHENAEFRRNHGYGENYYKAR